MGECEFKRIYSSRLCLRTLDEYREYWRWLWSHEGFKQYELFWDLEDSFLHEHIGGA